MRITLFFAFVVVYSGVYAQYTIPPYPLQVDGPTHTVVLHTALSDKYAAADAPQSDTLRLVSPDIKISKGIVDHKTVLGDMIARAYFVDSVMIGYIEYDGPSFLRERYLYPDGRVFLDKKYDHGTLISINTKVYKPLKK